MTPEQKLCIKSTWIALVPMSDRAASLFYDRLFEIDPATRALFRNTDQVQQGKKLMQALAAVVAGLDHLDQLLPTVEALGRRHAGYGVSDAHYDTVGAALLWTLEQGLEDSRLHPLEQRQSRRGRVGNARLAGRGRLDHRHLLAAQREDLAHR